MYLIGRGRMLSSAEIEFAVHPTVRLQDQARQPTSHITPYQLLRASHMLPGWKAGKLIPLK